MHLTHTRRIPLFLVAAALLCAAELWAASSAGFLQHTSVFAFAITADLLVGLPLLFYGLIVRPLRLAPITVIPVLLLAIVIAGVIVPPAGQTYLDRVRLLVPLLELTLLATVVWRTRGIVRAYRAARRQEPYLIDALETSVQATFGRAPAVTLLITELTLISLAFFGWFMRFRPLSPRDRAFTYHRTSLYLAIFFALLVLIGLETLALHLLIQRWSPLAAWIMTGLSIYSVFWVIGDWNAIRLHPILLSDTVVYLRSGLRWKVTLPLTDIVAIDKPQRADAKASDYLSFALAGPPQLVLVLKEAVRVQGLFGMTKEVRRIGLFLDDVVAFRAELERRG